MMSQRKKWLFSMVLALLVINFWQWWPLTEQTVVQGAQETSKRIQADDLRLSGYATDDMHIRKVHRDLFVMPVKQVKSTIASKPTVAKSRKTVTPKRSTSVVKHNQDQSGLNRFKLVGVLFQNGEKSAYLIKDNKDYSVQKGDKIDGRYLVKEVTVSTITLLESNTQKSSIVYMQ